MLDAAATSAILCYRRSFLTTTRHCADSFPIQAKICGEN
jgi:hypothetical protein